MDPRETQGEYWHIGKHFTQIVKNECDALDEMYDRGKFENWLFQKIVSGLGAE